MFHFGVDLKLLVFLTLLFGQSLQQEATYKCVAETTFRVFGVASYYDRSAKYTCSFENVKSAADMAKVNSNASVLTSQRTISIIFVNSSLSQLPEKMFAAYPNIKVLDASRLVVDEIHPSAFFDVKFWDSIDISNNNLKTLAARTFASMQIKSLDLSQNLIASIDEKAFLNAEIEKINLSFNQLKSITFLNSFAYFNLVLMPNNSLENFEKLEVKKDGWLSRRGIFNDDPEYPKFYLQNNNFKKIDCSSSIRINSLALEENPKLTEVSLNQCAVDEIDVSNCTNLKKVSFNDNLLGFTAKNVNLIDVDMTEAKSLTSLSLANAMLSKATFENILKMENLTLLDLSYTPIGPLNISTFAKLKALQFLNLKATNISNIQFGTFSHQHSVKQLDISDNHLGYFDMNMIFSMNSLLSLDLSGNDLTSLENFESAHFTFTLLQKIDLSNNKWPCQYLMRLIKVFRVYKVALTRSYLEENGANVHGIGCVHTDGDEALLDPLPPGSSNLTEIRDKMNQLIEEVSKNKNNVDFKLRQLESKLDDKLSTASKFEALQSEKPSSMVVKNSTLLESSMIIVCLCFAAFIAMKAYVFVKDNFFRRPRHIRTDSHRTLSMNVDEF